MLFLPLVIQAFALLSSFPLVDTPHLPNDDSAFYDGTTNVSISRYGFSPSFNLSVPRVGYTPSYALTVSRVGSTPSLALTSAHSGDSTSLLEPRMCVFDRAEWNDSGWCTDGVAPFYHLFWLRSLCMSVSIAILRCLIASCLGFYALVWDRLCAPCFVWLCACLLRGIRACFVSGLRVIHFAGLCFLIVLICCALLGIGILAFIFAFVTLVAFQLIVFLLFNCFCGCLFVGHLWYNIYVKLGPRACSALGICLGSYYGMGMPLFVGLCAFYYHGICKIFDNNTADRAMFAGLISSVSFWLGDNIENFVHSIWRPLFGFSSGVFFCLSFLAHSFVFLGPNATFSTMVCIPFLCVAIFF